MAQDEDPTLVLRRPLPAARIAPPMAAAPPRRSAAIGMGLAVALLGVAGGGWWFLGGPPPVTTAPVVAPAPALVPAPAFTVLDEAGMLAHRDSTARMLRLAGNPAVFVIDFPSLDEQGAAMNRIAALVEKAGLPRERVLDDAELAAAIARAGDTPATWYFGHNYRGADVARFFRLAARDGVRLGAAEAWLEARFREARAAVPEGAEIAVLSMAAPGRLVDEAGRAAILRHELGHGLFATTPAYAAHIRLVWRERFSDAERAAFRGFLAREGYDATNEELMLDEAQAYLLHTPDPRFFNAALVGLEEAQVSRLRFLMREGAPSLR
jgi:hypothetical protein